MDGLSDEQAAAVQMFASITGQSEEESRNYLEAFEWNMEEAVNSTFGDTPVPAAPAPAPSAPAAGEPIDLTTGGADMDAFVDNGGAAAAADAGGWGVGSVLSGLVNTAWSAVDAVVGGAIGGGGGGGGSGAGGSGAGRDVAGEFVAMYESVYGDDHPAFFHGTYTEAVAAARREHRFLLVYLHASKHENTPAFCRDVLAAPQLIELMNSRFLVWAGDLSAPEAFAVNNQLHASTYPFLGVLASYSGAMSLIECMQGELSADQVLARLLDVLEQHGPLLAAARADHAERTATRSLRQEQDDAYQQSLRADMERERAAREAAEAEARAARDAEEAARRAAEEAAAAEAARVAAEEARARAREERARRLPAEPAAGAGVSTLAIKLPDGTRLRRRFTNDSTLQVVLDYVDSTGFDVEGHCLASNYPVRKYDDAALTLEQAELTGQQMLFVQQM